VDVAVFLAATDQLRETLSTLGPGRMSELDTAFFPVLRLAPSLDEETGRV
jgi:hypothetical protein